MLAREMNLVSAFKSAVFLFEEKVYDQRISASDGNRSVTPVIIS